MRNCHFAAGGVGNLACFSHSLAQEDLGMLEANSLNYRWQIKHMNMQGKWCLDIRKSCCLAWQSKKDHIFPNFFHKQVPCSRNFIPSRHAFYGRIAVAAGDVAGPAGRHGSPWLSRCWIFEADQSNTWNLGTVSLQKSKTYFTYLYIMIIQDYTRLYKMVFPGFSQDFRGVFPTFSSWLQDSELGYGLRRPSGYPIHDRRTSAPFRTEGAAAADGNYPQP